MNAFLKRRANDARFALQAPRPEVALHIERKQVPWYQESTIVRETHNASAASGIKRERHTAAMKTGKDGKKQLTEGETSDGSDDGVCWSDYERVPGTKEGEKGSCRPKGSKKSKKSD